MGRCQALLGDSRWDRDGKAGGQSWRSRRIDPYSWSSRTGRVVRHLHHAGAVRSRIGLLEQAARMCSAGKFSRHGPIVNRFLGEAYCLWGRDDEGVRLLEGAVQDLAAVKYMPALPGAYASLSEGYLLAGVLARPFARPSRRESCPLHTSKGTEAAVVRILGEIGRAESSAPGETKALFSEAWQGPRSENHRDGPLCAGPQSSLKERGVGQRGPPRASRLAVQMLTEMGMHGGFDEAQADRAEPHVHRIAFGRRSTKGRTMASHRSSRLPLHAGPRTRRGEGEGEGLRILRERRPGPSTSARVRAWTPGLVSSWNAQGNKISPLLHEGKRSSFVYGGASLSTAAERSPTSTRLGTPRAIAGLDGAYPTGTESSARSLPMW